ncbi:hypothetical protein MGG_08527 [Pyricularia oryzae 70-15]|uniref:NAD-dependent epimerase/dehydratase domain-containing protein n=2 Tax=Pyricularia oryzae TaxID=318829 RepID=G4N5T6_PYRO7|nr:uncharacterized protein MGG_08527 [Pyricularia oryzae 70-15]EHA49712.1 hypothetical protein MGG_08527 [Pyricularia oryzae 70-15]ELQ43345.1 hypothetical protein OOU_Y34scaffold00159g10 [Pyricularia oryzae Y34]
MSAQNKPTILITGASGMIGPLLAARLLSTDTHRVVLTDVVAPTVPPSVAHPENAVCIQADLTNPAALEALVAASQPLTAAFVFHGIMSAGSEADPALAMRVNFDATRALLTHLASTNRGLRVVYASSNAVYGTPLPDLVTPATTPTPTGTYGATKYLCEVLVNDMTRRGLVDAYSVRFPTVSVRPGAPSNAASAFLSGIIREPLAGLPCVVPIADRAFRATLCTPRVCVENLVRVLGWPADKLPPHTRALNFPGIVSSVQEMLDALVRYGGEDKAGLVSFEEDEVKGRLLRSWAWNLDYSRELGLGLVQDENTDQLVRDMAFIAPENAVETAAALIGES